MSLVAHPERNVFITGWTESPYIDVARVLSVRLGRRICDIQAETRKRKLLTLSAVLGASKNESEFYTDILHECAQRRNQIACLDYASLASVAGYEQMLSRFYVVVLLNQPGNDEPETEAGPERGGPEMLPSDLQLNWSGFQARQLARIITHCLYG